ncbi:GNAT family N-acetyltransferase [Lutibacter sp. TH_r2]|uniref:GNAT family N-acetyltransferase n=1 Tax=Lutibacter sp. TH_r2 TaxID=3082083 RepID=UPI0029555DED|nr:GNAT family N-acetyltransferase [Lutibacter sp. TH_r2]MDV7188035.1 GNAT family N-acetyltransferase [Lutibacter sp. TH_r2]
MIQILKPIDIPKILLLVKQLNPTISETILEQRQKEMFKIENYYCFGFYIKAKLIGVSSGWLTTRLYSGKQLEIDNVIIDSSYQSKGFGKDFLNEIELWAKNNKCNTVELNT